MTLPDSIFPHFEINTQMPEPRRIHPDLPADLEDLLHRLRVRYRPDQMASRGIVGQAAEHPLSEADAGELYRRLADHFHAWTGRDLHTYRPGSSATGEQPCATS